MTPICPFALLMALKGDFAAQAYVESGLDICIRYNDLNVDILQLMVLHWCYKHCLLAPIGPFALVFAPKNDFAAQAYNKSDFLHSYKVYDFNV